MTQDIIDLVEQAKNGSERAFNKLYDKYYKTMWFTIYNIVKNRDVTEDLISVVFTKAFHLCTFKITKLFTIFIFN